MAFEYRTPIQRTDIWLPDKNCLLLEWFCYSNVLYSDPHCISNQWRSKLENIDLWNVFGLLIFKCKTKARWYIGMSSASYTQTTAVRGSNPDKGENIKLWIKRNLILKFEWIINSAIWWDLLYDPFPRSYIMTLYTPSREQLTCFCGREQLRCSDQPVYQVYLYLHYTYRFWWLAKGAQVTTLKKYLRSYVCD